MENKRGKEKIKSSLDLHLTLFAPYFGRVPPPPPLKTSSRQGRFLLKPRGASPLPPFLPSLPLTPASSFVTLLLLGCLPPSLDPCARRPSFLPLLSSHPPLHTHASQEEGMYDRPLLLLRRNDPRAMDGAPAAGGRKGRGDTHSLRQEGHLPCLRHRLRTDQS